MEYARGLVDGDKICDAEISRKKKGTGLGLATVEHIVNRHRGQLSFKSSPGEGMRVDVFLP